MISQSPSGAPFAVSSFDASRQGGGMGRLKGSVRAGIPVVTVAVFFTSNFVYGDDGGDLFGRLLREVTIPVLTSEEPQALYPRFEFVPLPGQPSEEEIALRNAETKRLYTHWVHEAMDRYFNEVIGGYSDVVKAELREMYYRGKGITHVSGLLEAQTAYGVTTTRFSSNDVRFDVALDERFRALPLHRKCVLIHEVGVHVGQHFERAREVGHAIAAQEDDAAWSLFTELSAAVVESKIHKLIPLRYFQDELDASGLPESFRKDLMEKNAWATALDSRDYALTRNRLYYSREPGGRTLEARNADRFFHEYLKQKDREGIAQWAFQQAEEVKKTGHLKYKYLPAGVPGLTDPIPPAKDDAELVLNLVVERVFQLEQWNRPKKK